MLLYHYVFIQPTRPIISSYHLHRPFTHLHLLLLNSIEFRDRFRKETIERKRLHNMVQELKGNIRVYMR